MERFVIAEVDNRFVVRDSMDNSHFDDWMDQPEAVETCNWCNRFGCKISGLWTSADGDRFRVEPNQDISIAVDEGIEQMIRTEVEFASYIERCRKCKFKIGDLVRKVSGSEWEGQVVGYYMRKGGKIGVCIESGTHKGSIQIYPEEAVEAIEC